MYKSKLQEFCQKRSWRLPEYAHAHEGPNHRVRFSASVTVNGRTFDTPAQWGTSKSAQNEAARIAFLHFAEPQAAPEPLISSLQGSSPSPLLPGSSSVGANLDRMIPINESASSEDPQIDFTPDFIDSMKSSGVSDVGSNLNSASPNNGRQTFQAPQIHASTPSSVDDKMHAVLKDVKDYKSLLHVYTQKRNLPHPDYFNEMEGLPHDSRFKSKVTVDGQTFEGPGVFHTLRDAEHAAAKIALQSLSTDRVLEDDSIPYKNILQVLGQKEGLGLPMYSTKYFGECHRLTFVSTVKIGEEIFEGNEAKAKRQAESNAAKVAFNTLMDRKKSSGPKVASTEYVDTVVMGQLEEDRGRKRVKVDPPDCQVPESHSSSFVPINFEKNGRDIVGGEHSEENKAKDQKEVATVNASVNTQFASQKSVAPATNADSSSSMDAIYVRAVNHPSPPRSVAGLADSKMQVDREQCRKVVVFPQSPNMALPAGIDSQNVLSISDEKWVAVNAAPAPRPGN